MNKKKIPIVIMIGSCIAMMCVNVFAWNFSSISLMLIAALVSLSVFIINGTLEQKGGAEK